MLGHTSHVRNAKRAVYAGLFLGMLCFAGSCGKPAVSSQVTKTPVPVITEAPKGTNTPTPPVPTTSPQMTQGAPTMTPEPTATIAPTPTPSITPTPTVVPKVTPTKKPVATPTSVPVITRIPTVVPTAIPTKEPTIEPTVGPTMTPAPVPTEVPDYAALIQNGWQRTEDFFGNREILFSGLFDKAEVFAVSGRYEYRYTAAADERISFSVIGEEDMQVQQFLDELTQQFTDCLIAAEGEEDYSYTYQKDEMFVTGRIYACKDGEKKNRMRVEFCSPAGEAGKTEGYGFYLKRTER